uniref:Uncharacterized protein n=1 Tax=Oryza sativa subsp. japonica TaxID=39947 RepID=Q6ER18_ORYSJ|nr:hypothetical protein [Oryza sativa Japonica Group]
MVKVVLSTQLVGVRCNLGSEGLLDLGHPCLDPVAPWLENAGGNGARKAVANTHASEHN